MLKWWILWAACVVLNIQYQNLIVNALAKGTALMYIIVFIVVELGGMLLLLLKDINKQ